MVRWAFYVPLLFVVLFGQNLGPVPKVIAEDRMQTALELLSRTASGKLLVERAAHAWGVSAEDLTRKFRWGNVSRTHAVLTRKLDAKTGTEQRERDVTVFIRHDATLEEIVLDMAHELVHAVARPAWDPYDPSLTAGKYIASAIDGEGGEVDAMVSECSVQRELEHRFGPLSKRCAKYVSQLSGRVDRESIQKDFYRVGKFYPNVLHGLSVEAERLPLLSNSAPELYSSTGRAPYPMALLDEYEELTRVACENSRKRIEVISSQSVRAPASTKQPVRENTEQFLRKRCG